MSVDQVIIRRLLDEWASAVRAHDLDAVLRHRSKDIVMFDVPEPLQARGIDAYCDTWKLYFKSEGSRYFELHETRIVAGVDVAFVHSLLRCTTAPEPEGRLTLGLRKIRGQWIVEHEHHSFPALLGDQTE